MIRINLILLGTNDDDMLAVAEELIRIGGGVAVADGGKTIGSLPLPIGGLMSNRAAVDTAQGPG
jgi:adenine deaminase